MLKKSRTGETLNLWPLAGSIVAPIPKKFKKKKSGSEQAPGSWFHHCDERNTKNSFQGPPWFNKKVDPER